MLHNDIVDMQ